MLRSVFGVTAFQSPTTACCTCSSGEGERDAKSEPRLFLRDVALCRDPQVYKLLLLLLLQAYRVIFYDFY